MQNNEVHNQSAECMQACRQAEHRAEHQLPHHSRLREVSLCAGRMQASGVQNTAIIAGRAVQRCAETFIN